MTPETAPSQGSNQQADAEVDGRDRLPQALRRCQEAIERDPDDPAAYRALGNLLQQLRRYEDAIASLDRAIALDASYPQAYSNRGNALLALERFADAIESYDRAIALKPDYAPAYNNRGNALKSLRRFAEAVESYERAIQLLPDRAELYNNRGNAFQELECFERAIESYDVATRIDPTYAAAYSNRGSALKQVKRLDEAMADFDRALLLKPDYAEASWNKALLCLLLGQFSSGWRGYEARKRTRKPVGNRNFSQPLWLGDTDISGKTLLVHWEQGYGDVILFSRYVALCQRAGARVLFAPQKPLRTLMQGLDAHVQIVDLDNDFPLFDFHCPIMSLPLAFQTDLTTVPRGQYIVADNGKIAAWADRLGKKTKPRIGVVWSRTGLPDSGRTIVLERFQRLFHQKFEFVSLQKHLTAAECGRLDCLNVPHPGEALVDFSDTAALSCLMDLVISIDTSVAHLAGALAVPVWVLLPWFPGWLWMLDRDDSPWYPLMRLFRQQAPGDWDGVLQRVQMELQDRFD